MGFKSRLCLASASPRRQELLSQVGIEFEAMAADIPEDRQAGETPADFVQRIAREKTAAVAERRLRQGFPILPVLGADTCIDLDGELLGKPRDREHGLAVLRKLSGRKHKVLSAFSLFHEGSVHSVLNESHVSFCEMSDSEIAVYWATGEPADKAGAYAVQGRGAAFISHIEGSYSGIVGLPLFELVQTLKTAGLMAP